MIKSCGPFQKRMVVAQRPSRAALALRVNRPGVAGDSGLGRSRTEFMPREQTAGKPAARRYSSEEKRAAVRMVRALQAETGMTHGAVRRVAEQLGYGVESCAAGSSGPTSMTVFARA